MTPSAPLALVSWRRAITDLYATVRHEATEDPLRAWETFRSVRNDLFAQHVQTPLSPAQQSTFRGISYFPYDPAWRLVGRIDHHVPKQTFDVELGDDGRLQLTSVATTLFSLQGHSHRLTLYWIEGYGGGLFLPFRDRSCGGKTYGGGRYLYDTIKGADPGLESDRIILDFNFAYNPSCAYNSQWVCPLSPPENHLEISIEAGEHNWVDTQAEIG